MTKFLIFIIIAKKIPSPFVLFFTAEKLNS